MRKKLGVVRPEKVDPLLRYCNYLKISGVKSWGPREIPDYELIYVVAGGFSYEMDGLPEKVMLGEGDVLCIPPRRQHVFKCEHEPAYGAIISCIHFDLLKKGSAGEDYVPETEPPLLTAAAGDNPVHQLFRNCNEIFNSYGLYRGALLDNMFRELWLRLNEYWQGSSRNMPGARTGRMVRYIESRIPRGTGRRDLSRAFGISPEHINAIFKRELGMTPTMVANRARINLACRCIIDEGLSVKEAADKAGFSDMCYFSRVFKKIMDVTPGRFQSRR